MFEAILVLPMWRVHKTACFPRAYKVNASHSQYEGDNCFTNFFKTEAEATKEANRRNKNECQGRHWNCGGQT